MKRVPIQKADLLDILDNKELFEGYCDGRDNAPAPGGNRSYSYWHGWRNGMMDGNHMPHDGASRTLAKDAIDSGYFKKLRIQL